jgi:hypothetical protein
MPCSKCNLAALPDSADVIKCVKCVKHFHASCTRLRTTVKLAGLGAKRDTWQCDNCTNSPGTAPFPDMDPIFQAINSLGIQLNSKLDANYDKLASLESAVNNNTSALNEIRNTLSIVKLETENLKSECEGLKLKNEELSRDLWDTRQELCDLQQYSRINNIEITGIPVTDNEDIYLIMDSMAKALNLTYSRTDISIAHRIPKTKNAKHPSIIVCFISRTTRDAWLSAGRSLRLTTKKVNAALQEGDVFINEHLTPQNKYLLSYGKKFARMKNLDRAWFRNGKMWIKLHANDRPIRVWSPEDIDQVMMDKRNHDHNLVTK